MDYSLAKLLKDAGFYQSGKGTRVAPPHMIVVRRDDFAYVPTLEELVEACGKGLWTMRQCTYQGEWGWCVGQDSYISDNPNDWPLFAFGTTLVEALGRLWLSLNKMSDA